MADTNSTSTINFETTQYTPENHPPINMVTSYDNSTAGQISFDPTTGFTTGNGLIWVYYYDKYFALMNSVNLLMSQGVSAPENATFVQPPEYEKGKTVPIFNTTTHAWSLAEDIRGTGVYNKKTREFILWNEPGPITSDYTTISPSTKYDVWNEANNSWVTDTNLQHADIKKQAMVILNQNIIPTINYLQFSGMEMGPIYKAYQQKIAQIAWGKDMTSTVLPDAPSTPPTE